MNSSEQIKQHLEFLQETRSREYKKSTAWRDKNFKVKIVKTILALSNIRDGGVILFGVSEQTDGSYLIDGMTDDDYESYNNDDLSDFISNYADPYVEFELHRAIIDEKKYVMINVFEFDEIPVICKKDHTDGTNHIIRRGAIYTRSTGKPSVVEVPTQTEMREILDMATEKRLKKHYEMMEKIPTSEKPDTSDVEKFIDQMKDLTSDE